MRVLFYLLFLGIATYHKVSYEPTLGKMSVFGPLDRCARRSTLWDLLVAISLSSRQMQRSETNNYHLVN